MWAVRFAFGRWTVHNLAFNDFFTRQIDAWAGGGELAHPDGGSDDDYDDALVASRGDETQDDAGRVGQEGGLVEPVSSIHTPQTSASALLYRSS